MVSQGEEQTPNAHQKYAIESLILELNIFLQKKNLITKVLEERGQEEVYIDELKKLLQKSGKQASDWKASEVTIDGSKVFIRPGSKKPKGWQITIRGGKPGSFIDCFKNGAGSLLINRDGVILIPLKEVQKVIKDKTAYEQDTIDVYIDFGDQVTLKYKDEILDITKFRLFSKT